jgi:P4 family phage/plasmid primase-like protien
MPIKAERYVGKLPDDYTYTPPPAPTWDALPADAPYDDDDDNDLSSLTDDAEDDVATEDGEEMRQHLALVVEPGQVVELRFLGVKGEPGGWGGPHTVSGYFDNMDKLVAAALRIGPHAQGTYITLNPVNPALLSRRRNRTEPAGKDAATTADGDIPRRRWLLIDCDPHRPSGISATAAERDAAGAVASVISNRLDDEGWPTAIWADSGNGTHLLYPIDLPADDGGLVKRTLEVLAAFANTDAAAVDIKVFNPARITKLYGAVARKGDDTPDRPHRTARMLHVPDARGEPVTAEMLEAVIAHLAPASRVPATTPTSVQPPHPRRDEDPGLRFTGDNLEAWIAAHELDVRDPQPYGDDATKWVFNVCPFNPDHTNGSAVLIRQASGAVSFTCHHNGCAGNDWHALRRLVGDEPQEGGPAPSTREKQGTNDGAGVDPASYAANTDTGNAERLAAEYAARLRYVPALGWLAYDEADGLWKRDAGALLAQRHTKAMLYGRLDEVSQRRPMTGDDWKELRHIQTAFNRVRQIVDNATSSPALEGQVADFDNDPWLLGATNGVVNLRDGSFTAGHAPTPRLTRQAAVAYDPQATAPTWERFLRDIFRGDSELIAYVQRALGYSLVGVVRDHVFYVCYGTGRNGKSTLLNAVSHVLGGYAAPLRSEALMRQQYGANSGAATPELAALVGRRFVTAQEPPHGRLDTARVKELTGGDPIQVRENYGHPFTLVPQFKLWLSTNERPEVEETTTAVWDRIKLIPFLACFSGREDRLLPEKLAAEGSGILNWLLEGVALWQRDGVGDARAVHEATTDYRTANDPLLPFFTHWLVKAVGERVKGSEAQSAFWRWRNALDEATRNELPDYTSRALYKEMEHHGYVKRTRGGAVYLSDCRLTTDEERAVSFGEEDEAA